MKFKPIEVSDTLMVFPGNIEHLLPDQTDVVGNKWLPFVNRWFYKGIEINLNDLKPKEGIETIKAFRHLNCIMRSYSIKHENKIASVAYLLNEWFE